MPVFTVASKFAFSKGGRVLDLFHSSLSHEKSGVPYLYTRLSQRHTSNTIVRLQFGRVSKF